jgi:hypothetical protein
MGKDPERDVHMHVSLATLACFLLTSTGYLSWVYRLMKVGAPFGLDALTFAQVEGYLSEKLAFWGRNLSRRV